VRQKPLPSVWRVTKLSALLLWRHKKLFIGVIAIYGLLNMLFVQGYANSTDITNWHNSLDKTLHGNLASIGSGVSIFAVMVGSSSNGSTSASGAYQVILLLIVSLALIWSLRQVAGGTAVRIRDAYYRGMFPLVPFVLVLVVVGLELLPAVIGGVLFTEVMANGIASSGLEKIVWSSIFIGSIGITLFLIVSSIFALYIVTLPDMTPLKALRSARELVRYRRWTLLVKLLYVPIVLLVAISVILAPVVLFVTSATQVVFFAVSLVAFAALHAYLYTLYKEMLHD
jgi:hypothetical protein